MKLRNHLLMTRRSGVKSWPPSWVDTRGMGYDKLSGEIGVLTRVDHHDAVRKGFFLWMVYEGQSYIGAMHFDDGAFCKEIRIILEASIGLSMTDIGEIDLSYML